MSAVDAPPGISFAGQAAGEFVARRRSRVLSRFAFGYVISLGTLAFVVASRRLQVPMIEILLVAPLMCGSIAAVGFAVRRARLKIDHDGVWWGWRIGGFRMRPERIRSVTLYSDAVALAPNRGSTWYLAARDWDAFDKMPKALGETGLEVIRSRRRAPFRAKLQSYGIVLDLLMLVNALAVSAALVIAVAL